jgi:tRNA(Ile)-lysidine synthase TilS/MesJ
MPAVSGRYRRPLLGVSRETARAALPPDVKPWEDPHNADPAYARPRVRHRVLPVLEAELGPGVAEALSRTAALLRADAEALEAWADRAFAEAKIEVTSAGPEHHQNHPGHVSLDVARLAELPQAVRTRAIRRAAIEAGCPSTDLTAAHVTAVDALITQWHGQRGIDLPGPVRAARAGRMLRFAPSR